MRHVGSCSASTLRASGLKSKTPATTSDRCHSAQHYDSSAGRNGHWWNTRVPATTYFPRENSSIFGADRFNFSVRNGKRWDPIAIITEVLLLSFNVLVAQSKLNRKILCNN